MFDSVTMFAASLAALLFAAPPAGEQSPGAASAVQPSERTDGDAVGEPTGVVGTVEGPAEPESGETQGASDSAGSAERGEQGRASDDQGQANEIARRRRPSLGSRGESPRRASDPYLPAIQIDVMAGPTLCFGGGPARGRCNPVGSTRGTPGLGLSATAGGRINRYLLVGAAFTLGSRTAGETPEGNLAFSSVQHLAVHGLVRGILPAGRNDFSLGLGVGYGSLTLESPAQAAVDKIDATAISLRPSIGWDIWAVTDFSLGIRATALVNFYTQFCADSQCAVGDLAPVPSTVRDVFTHALIIGVELSGLLVFW